MRVRSNLLVLLGIAFFVVGGLITFIVTGGSDTGPTKQDRCRDRGGVYFETDDLCVAGIQEIEP